jgi:N-acetylmuramoyl-L-alanine amidase
VKYRWQCGIGLVAAMLLCATGLAQAQAGKAAAKQSAVASCEPAHFRIIIDVGHSAEVPGALSARGVPEYNFNLNLARKIEAKLREAGFAKTTLLITPGKAMAGLLSRINYTARNPGDLFLSIHHDAVPERFLQKWTFEGKEHRYCDRFSGHSIFVSNDNDEYPASLKFARLLGLQLKAQGLQYTPHYVEKFMGRRQRQLVDAEAGVYRFDHLVVLRSTNMPAVLLEAGSIVNRDEELRMADPEHQALIATAVLGAVEQFCRTRPPRKQGPHRFALNPFQQAAEPAAPSE